MLTGDTTKVGLEFGNVGFWGEEKPEYPEKTSRSKDENQQQTQPTYDAGSGNRTQAKLVGEESSHHCAIPAPLKQLRVLLLQPGLDAS